MPLSLDKNGIAGVINFSITGNQTIGNTLSVTGVSTLNTTALGATTVTGNLTISASSYSCVAIKTDGTLWGWGAAGSGQLGLTTTVNRSSPVQVGALTNWASVASGDNSTVGIK